MNVNETMRELTQYTRLQKEASAWKRRSIRRSTRWKKNTATQSDGPHWAAVMREAGHNPGQNKGGTNNA